MNSHRSQEPGQVHWASSAYFIYIGINPVSWSYKEQKAVTSHYITCRSRIPGCPPQGCYTLPELHRLSGQPSLSDYWSVPIQRSDALVVPKLNANIPPLGTRWRRHERKQIGGRGRAQGAPRRSGGPGRRACHAARGRTPRGTCPGPSPSPPGPPPARQPQQRSAANWARSKFSSHAPTGSPRRRARRRRRRPATPLGEARGW